jgi:hypothetical protein
MATLNQILANQAKLIGEAKGALEEAQRTPPATDVPIELKKATVAELEARVTNLTAAKAEATRKIDEQIDAYKSEIAALKYQIQDDKK